MVRISNIQFLISNKMSKNKTLAQSEGLAVLMDYEHNTE
jgi:hypothetical protein